MEEQRAVCCLHCWHCWHGLHCWYCWHGWHVVYTIDMVYTVDMVCTVDMACTVDWWWMDRTDGSYPWNCYDCHEYSSYSTWWVLETYTTYTIYTAYIAWRLTLCINILSYFDCLGYQELENIAHNWVREIMTWCQILCTMRFQRVSKILTPRRMLQKTWLIA